MNRLLKPLISSILCGCVLLGASQVATAATSAQNIKATQKVSFLSTLLAKTGDIQKTTHGYRLILMNVDPRMLWFADRPKRLAGFTSTTNFIENWKNYFKTSNPNAAVVHVRFASKQGFVESPMAVEISNPLLVNGRTLIFDMKPLSRNVSLGVLKLPVLFIDGGNVSDAVAAPAAAVGIGGTIAGADLAYQRLGSSNQTDGSITNQIENQIVNTSNAPPRYTPEDPPAYSGSVDTPAYSDTEDPPAYTKVAEDTENLVDDAG